MDNDAVYLSSPMTRRKVTDLFTREEIKQLTLRSDWMGGWAVLSTWAVIAAAFVLLSYAVTLPWMWAIPLVVLCMTVIAGRQLCLAILMHEASHATLFKTRWLNDVLTDWLCARPIWNDLKKYRAHHFMHHTKTGTAEDTDITLSAPFPVSRASLTRKFLRDITGLTGLKYYLGRFLMDIGIIKWTVADDIQRLSLKGYTPIRYIIMVLRNILPMLIMNGALFAIFYGTGHPYLYGFWILSYMTPFPLLIRIRSMAEHACTEKSLDMFKNTRTTHAGWLARMTVAPVHVNYHIEHHVMASVPYFRLPQMHAMLRSRGAVETPPGYLDVLRIVSNSPSTTEMA